MNIANEMVIKKMQKIGLLMPNYTQNELRAAISRYQISREEYKNPRNILCQKCFHFFNENEIENHNCTN